MTRSRPDPQHADLRVCARRASRRQIARCSAGSRHGTTARFQRPQILASAQPLAGGASRR